MRRSRSPRRWWRRNSTNASGRCFSWRAGVPPRRWRRPASWRTPIADRQRHGSRGSGPRAAGARAVQGGRRRRQRRLEADAGNRGRRDGGDGARGVPGRVFPSHRPEGQGAADVGRGGAQGAGGAGAGCVDAGAVHAGGDRPGGARGRRLGSGRLGGPSDGRNTTRTTPAHTMRSPWSLNMAATRVRPGQKPPPPRSCGARPIAIFRS